MIIDCHCHAGTGDGLTGPWDTRAPLQDYLRRAATAGIGRTVIFAAFHSDYAVANQEVARIVASMPERFYGFAFVHPERDRGRVHALVEIAVKRYGFVGIKVHRHDAAITREVCAAARFSVYLCFTMLSAKCPSVNCSLRSIPMSTLLSLILAALPMIGAPSSP